MNPLSSIISITFAWMITNIQTHLKNFSRDTKQQLYFNALYYSTFVTQCDASKV